MIANTKTEIDASISPISPISLHSCSPDDDSFDHPKMSPIGFHGVMGLVAEAACENSEADPVAVCAYFMARFGAMLGRNVFQYIGDAELHTRPYILLVGDTAKARKGTSEAFPSRLFERAEELLTTTIPKLKVHSGGLSSGEGVGYELRDASEKVDAEGNSIDAGVKDKRIIVVEAEFANVLTLCKRDGNTLSSTIRNLWDGKDIAPLTKNSRWKASKPHCTIMAHVTSHEFLERISSNDMANGFMNRFIVVAVTRRKLVPNPKPTNKQIVETLATELVKIIEFVIASTQDENPLAICFSEEAMTMWCDVYHEISSERPGIEGTLLARTETYARMLAMIFAILDRSNTINTAHLKAALAWIDYWVNSIAYIFNDRVKVVRDQKALDNAHQIRMHLCRCGKGCSRSEISREFHGHLSKKELDEALAILLNSTSPLITANKIKTDGAMKTVYTFIDGTED